MSFQSWRPHRASGAMSPRQPMSFRQRSALIAASLTAVLVAIVAGPAFAADGAAASVTLSPLSAIVLGLVEGLTEYLPVSSTGHLLVTQEILGLGGTTEADEALETYAICIQAGAILAVFVLYRARLTQMVDGLLGRNDEGKRVLFAVIAAFVPTAIIGLALQGVVRDRLFGVGPTAFAWLVGGVFVLWLARSSLIDPEPQQGTERTGGFFGPAGIALTELSVRNAAVIGVFQAVALWPGVSRSLVTIAAGLLVGLALKDAVEFSFLLGLVTLSAATVFEGLSNGSGLIDQFGIANPLLGLVVAFISALFAVRWMVRWLEERSLAVFGYYRIAIGIFALGALGLGWF